MDRIIIEEMTWPAVRDALNLGWDRVLLPVGATEQHGPHLPIATDSLHTWEVAKRVAQILDRTLVAPLLRVGCSEHHMAFPGTVSLTKETLEAVVRDCCESLARSGFRTIMLFSGHGGNHPPLAEIASRLESSFSPARLVVYADVQAFMGGLMASAKRLGVPAETAGGHAGELETSMMLAMRADLVVRTRFEPGYIGELAPIQQRVLEDGLAAITPNGILGDPRQADATRGITYLNDYAQLVASYFQDKLGG